MKQPRTSDFDPSTKRHPLKSSMANMPVIEKPSASPQAAPPVTPVDNPSNAKTSNEPITVAAQQSSKAPASRTSGKEHKRQIKTRQPFDIYQDQVDALKRLAFEEKMQGGLGSMSAMVRDALDAYLSGRQGQGSH
jgi:hypothetical protein